MTTSTEYEQAIEEIHAAAARLRDMVARGIVSQSALDAYLHAAQARSDWSDA